MRPGRPNGGDTSRKNVMAEIDHSLKRSQLDCWSIADFRNNERSPYISLGKIGEL